MNQHRITAPLGDADHETETIFRISTLLAAELDLDKLIQTITDEATALIQAGFGSFFYNALDERGEAYVLYTLSGAPREAFAKFPMPRNTKVFDPTFRNAGTLRSDDILQDPRYGQNPPYKGMPEGHLPVRSYLAVSVVTRTGEVLGGLFFGHPEPGRFSEHHQRLIEGIAPQAAIAIENARLYQQARQQQLAAQERAQLAALSAEIGQALTVSSQSPATLQGCMEALLRHLPLSWAGIWLADTDDHVPAASAGELPEQLNPQAWAAVRATKQPLISPFEASANLPAGLSALPFFALYPLHAKQGVIGWLGLTASERPSDAVLGALEADARNLALGLEKWQALEQLNYQHALLQTISDNVTACLLMMDSEGRATFANPAVTRVMGYTPEELLGKRLHEMIHHTRPDGRPFPIEECPLDQALPQQASIQDYEDVFIRKDGSFFPVRCAGSPIYRDGRPVGTVIEVQDITQERAASASLQLANHQLALEKSRQDKLIRAMQAAQRTTARLLSERTRPAASQAVLDLLVQDLGVRCAGIWYYDSSRRKLLLEAGHGLEAAGAGLEETIDVTLNAYKIGWVARYQLPFAAQIDPDDLQFDQGWLRREELHAGMIYPLLGRSTSHGVLAAFLERELPVGFSEIVASLAAIFAASLDVPEG